MKVLLNWVGMKIWLSNECFRYSFADFNLLKKNKNLSLRKSGGEEIHRSQKVKGVFGQMGKEKLKINEK